MFKFLTILPIVIIFAGCGSSNTPEKPLVYVENVHLNATNEYDLITCMLDSKKIRIVAKRLEYSDCKTIVKERTYYKLDLQKIDTVVHATTNIHSSHGITVVHFGPDDPYLYDNRLVGELYTCPVLEGICITNPNIFHYP